eukprot:GGOE01021585.1.p1 GENE.GGOE01021585.1~~GGOE01021585.1.p1  ORF type:complete len:706 (+),score=240.65 GGOE01021585.1:49-2118(+)
MAADPLSGLYRLVAYLIGLLDWVLGLRTKVVLSPSVMSVEVGGPAPPGETRLRRNPDFAGKDIVVMAERKGKTMVEMHELSVRKHWHRPLFGWRPVLEVRTLGKTGTATTILGRPKLITYGEFHEKVVACSAALAELGLQPGDVVAFYEDTSMEWMLMAHAAWHHSMTITTVYASLGLNALVFALNQTGAKAVFTNAKHVRSLVEAGVPSLSTIVYRETLDSVPLCSLNVISAEELEAKGRTLDVLHNKLPSAEDIACIMYTSGTTGDPKGVLLTHRNLTAAVVSMLRIMGLGEDLTGRTVVMFLPLGHIYTLVTIHTTFIGGALTGFGTVNTLTDTFTKPHGDLREWRPSMLCVVPRVLDIFKKTIEGRLATQPPFTRMLFQAALQARKTALSQGRDTPLWNRLVFRNVRLIFGNRLDVMFCGGAPLNAKTQEFIRIVLGTSMEQGYGLTETTSCLSVQYFNDLSVGNVGAVHDPCEVKLVDIPEMGYTSADKPCPQGEIVVRGPVVSPGYFQLPDVTAEVFTDGWFRTGDVGMWLPSGALRLIDRKKNLVKLAMGEYVALEKLESIYSNVRFVQPNGICCVANPEKMYVVALILINKEPLLHAARTNKWSFSDANALLSHPQAKRLVQEALDREAESCELKPFEMIKKFRLYDDTWTADNGMLTPAMKLVRRRVEEHYKADIATMYA